MIQIKLEEQDVGILEVIAENDDLVKQMFANLALEDLSLAFLYEVIHLLSLLTFEERIQQIFLVSDYKNLRIALKLLD